MSPMLIIAKREFRSYFDSPIAYIVICLSFFALGLMFFFLNGGFWQLDRASIARLFESTPMGLSFLVVPVVTMRLLAEERRSGTLEMLITLPVKDSDVVLGKYLGALGLVLVLVLSTLAYPLVMFKFPWNLGPLDGGPVGIESLSAAIGEERGTLEDVIEPFLIQQGFLMRTSRGRMATRSAYLHFGLRVPERVQSTLPLFEAEK